MAVHVGGRGPGHMVRTGGFEADAVLALAFTEGRYRVGSGSGASSDFASLPGLTVSRTGVGYAETTSGLLVPFASNVARITDKGLLVEEARTNLAKYSQEFDNVVWTKSDATITANQIAAPDGTLTGDLFTNAATSAPHAIYGTGLSAPSTVSATSVFIKKGTVRYVSLRGETTAGAATYPWITYDFDTNTIAANASVTSSGSVVLANGWVRIWLVSTPVNGSNMVIAASDIASAPITSSALGNSYSGGTGTFYVWGAQYEAGAFATSYIPTTSASATRGADNDAQAVANPTEWTLLGEIEHTGDKVATANRYVDWSDGTDSNKIIVQRTNTGAVVATVINAGVSTTIATSAAKSGARVIKWALVRSGGNFSLYVDGALIATAAAASPSVTGIQYGAFRSPGSGGFLNDYIRKLVLYPTAWSAGQAQAATQ